MASGSSEADIQSVVEFCAVSKDQAILLLKKNGFDSEKAIGAYFEDSVKALEPEQSTSTWQNDSELPNYEIDATEPSNLTAPSRPPSRLSTNNGNPIDLTAEHAAAHPNLSAPYSQRPVQGDDYDANLAKAMAASLEEAGGQQNGVTGSGQKFGPANQDHYDPNTWGMTHVSNATTYELIEHPEPDDRQRDSNAPAFLRPSEHMDKLGALLTILQSIPMSRAALLMNNSVRYDYGHSSQWWKGAPIPMTKVISLDQPDVNDDWADVLYECQRLMAFLDETKRAYGSIDQFGDIKYLQESPEQSPISKFFDTWSRAAVHTDKDNRLGTIFNSAAFKIPFRDMEDPIRREFYCIETPVEEYHGQTLYDVLDRTIWGDRLDDDPDEIWIETIAEIFTIRFFVEDKEQNGLGVEIPAVWYPDRYLDICKDASRQLRLDKLGAERERKIIEDKMNRYRTYATESGQALNVKEVLIGAATSAEMVVKNNLANGVPDDSSYSSTERSHVSLAEAQKCAEELKALAVALEKKMQVLEERRQKALHHLKQISRRLTEPTTSNEPPTHRYMLRGVSTLPHVTYVLRKNENKDLIDFDDATDKPEWQWWRLSFSKEDGKLQAEQKSQAPEEPPAGVVGFGYPTGAASEWSRKTKKRQQRNDDVSGYTTRKVTEAEVLEAAKTEGRSVLLVYANENAVNCGNTPIPAELKTFVDIDNKYFEAELAGDDPSTVMTGSQDFSTTDTGWPESEQGLDTVEHSTFHADNSAEGGQGYDQSIPTTLLHPPESEQMDLLGSSDMQDIDLGPNQEMQERSGGGGLLATNHEALPNEQSQSMDLIDVDADDDDTPNTTRSGYA